MLNWFTPASHSERARSGVSIPPCVMSVTYLRRTAAFTPGDERLEVAPQQRLAARPRDEHRVEEARASANVVSSSRRASAGVFQKSQKPQRALHRGGDLEVHELPADAARAAAVLEQEERDVIRLEAGGEHARQDTSRARRAAAASGAA
jgi:hypothetical protein